MESVSKHPFVVWNLNLMIQKRSAECGSSNNLTLICNGADTGIETAPNQQRWTWNFCITMSLPPSFTSKKPHPLHIH